MEWTEALKYGPISIAALTAFWTAGLLTLELNRATVRKGAQRLIFVFMLFSIALTVLAWGLTIYDNTQAAARARETAQFLKDERLSKIQTLIVKIDSEALNKVRSLDNSGSQAVVRSMCAEIMRIYKIAGGEMPTETCGKQLNIKPENVSVQ
jgi:hypothetical protein